MEVAEAALAQMFATVLPLLDERQRRVLAGAEARALGRGGIATVSRAAAMARSTVQKAVAEVDAGIDPAAPVRRPGAGRKRLIDKDPDLRGSTRSSRFRVGGLTRLALRSAQARRARSVARSSKQ